MTCKGLLLSVCTLAFALAIVGATFPADPSFIIDPNPPESGKRVTITVTASSRLPVTVEIQIDGVWTTIGTLQSVPGSLDFDVPATAAGDPFTVTASSPSSSSAQSGTIL